MVSDRYAVHDFVDVTQRQNCWAHLLRDLARISQRAGQAGQVGRGLLGAGYLLLTLARAGPQCRSVRSPAPPRQTLAAVGSALTQCTRTANTRANLLKLEPAL